MRIIWKFVKTQVFPALQSDHLWVVGLVTFPSLECISVRYSPPRWALAYGQDEQPLGFPLLQARLPSPGYLQRKAQEKGWQKVDPE